MRNLFLIFALATAAYAQKPETVLSTFYPKPGKVAELLALLREEWSVYTRLNLVIGEHRLFRATTEGGTSYFVEIFTWKDESIPDNAPPEVQKVWADLRANTSRLDFAEISAIPDHPPTARKLPEPSRP